MGKKKKARKKATQKQIVNALIQFIENDPEIMAELRAQVEERMRAVMLGEPVFYYNGRRVDVMKRRPEEFPEFTDERDFFDVHTEIDG